MPYQQGPEVNDYPGTTIRGQGQPGGYTMGPHIRVAAQAPPGDAVAGCPGQHRRDRIGQAGVSVAGDQLMTTSRQPRRLDVSGPHGAADRITTSGDRKSTRLNSSHGYISYAVFCLKKK